MAKETKTNAMRILDKYKIPYDTMTYACDHFIDGIHIADQLGQPYERMFKTLVTEGRSKNYYVFVIPVDQELDLKTAARAVGEKSVEMLHVRDIQSVTGYIRGGCTPIGMKKAFPTLIHASAQNFDTITISGGRIGLQIILDPRDLIQVTRGSYADIIMH